MLAPSSRSNGEKDDSMANYHCSIKSPLSPAKGKSLIVKAAYNARTQFRDERTGKLTKNYEKEGDVLASFVLYDERIKAPKWVKNDPEKMLNEAVKGLRKNGRQGQEIIVGLIDDLDLQHNKWMLNDFLREQITRKTGHVVFVNIHPPSEKGDQRNLHAHILLMPKKLGEHGFTNEVLPALTPQDYDRIRGKWAEYGWKELKKIPGMETEAERYRWGHLKLTPDPRDKRSWNGNNQWEKARDRGDTPWMSHCDREAQQHMGPQKTAMKRGGKTTKAERFNDYVKDKTDARSKGKPDPAMPADMAATRAVGNFAGFIAGGLESTLAPILTPRQKAEGRWADRQKRIAAKTSLWEQQRETEKALKHGLERD